MTKPIAFQKEILEEIKSILTQEKNKESNCISLYDVLNLIREMNVNFDKMDEKYQNLIGNLIDESELDYNKLRIIAPEFNYEKEELSLSLLNDGEFENIYFSKNNDDLYIADTNASQAEEIFVILSSVLSDCYDEFMKYKQFYTEYKSSLRSVNSNFFVSIHNYKISLYSSELEITSDFVLYNEIDNHYKYRCDSIQIIREFKNYADELFKKIYIKIDDCPKWSRDILYKIRQEQLEEDQKIEEKNKRKEMRKQKMLKIFPFLKK